MLTLIGREHNFVEKLFLKSVIKDMLFQTHVPLLILPDKTRVAVTPEHEERFDRIAPAI
jgi:hypothetical protein